MTTTARVSAVVVTALAVIGSVLLVATQTATTSTTTLNPNNAANTLGMTCSANVTYYGDNLLKVLAGWGVKNISVCAGYPYSMGGTENWTGNAADPLSGTSHAVQLRLKTSNFIGRAHALGLKVRLMVNLSNQDNVIAGPKYGGATPLCEWSNAACWTNVVLPDFTGIAGAMKLLGADGLFLDGEGYAQTRAWGWNWQNDRQSATLGQTAIRALVKQRGHDLMAAMVAADPGIDLSFYYGIQMTDGWNAVVQQKVNNAINPYADSIQVNFWDGMSSAEGYSHIRLTDATFYKTTNIFNAGWDTANQYNANRTMAYFSRNLSDWNYAASRVSINPEIWIDSDVANEGTYTAPRSTGYVADQLAHFRKWAMDGQFESFIYADVVGPWDPAFVTNCNCPGSNPYTPYVPGLQAAAQVGTVDTTPPGLTVTTPSSGAASTTATTYVMSGTATDDMAVRYVSWTNDRGGSGTVPMTWQVNSGDYATSYNWQMNWSASVPLQSGVNNVTVKAVDIHGDTRSQVVTLTSGITSPSTSTSTTVAAPTTTKPTTTTTTVPNPTIANLKALRAKLVADNAAAIALIDAEIVRLTTP